MSTQKLIEELQGWQEHYSDPADKNNYDFFTALIAAVDRLESAERERDALQEQVRALAAENSIQDFIISAVKDLVRESEGVAGWHPNGDIASWDKALPELNHSETPATDAALREIRAQAVEGFSEFCGDNSVFIQATCNYDSLADAAFIYLARIRAGEKP